MAKQNKARWQVTHNQYRVLSTRKQAPNTMIGVPQTATTGLSGPSISQLNKDYIALTLTVRE